MTNFNVTYKKHKEVRNNGLSKRKCIGGNGGGHYTAILENVRTLYFIRK